jgi:hypothetical protein
LQGIPTGAESLLSLWTEERVAEHVDMFRHPQDLLRSEMLPTMRTGYLGKEL